MERRSNRAARRRTDRPPVTRAGHVPAPPRQTPSARRANRPLSIDIAWHLRRNWRAAPLLRRVAEYTMRAEGFLTAELSIAVVGARAMRRLHHRFLGTAEITDVLAFDFGTAQRRRSGRRPVGQTRQHLEGEVILCGELARRRCQRRPRWLPAARAELALYLVHGILHLAGYDDRTPAQATRMHARTDQLLTALGLGPIFSGDCGGQRPVGRTRG